MSTDHANVAPESVERPLEALETREISRSVGPLQRLVALWQFRELLRNLVRKELKVRYKSSVLGFVWTLLNPTLYLVVFSIVFKFILRADIPYFAVFLLSGLLVWNLFSAAVSGGTTSIVGNASLVQKVWFPREILPAASIGAALVHFFFQFTVLITALAIFRQPPEWGWLPVLVPALLVLVVFAASLALLFGAFNVYLRDTQHLVELVLLAWFWLSPIIYPYRQVADRLQHNAFVLLVNPITSIVLTFQRVIYNPDRDDLLPDAGFEWYARNLAIVGAASVVALLAALVIFGRLEDNFAEEI